MATGPWQAWYAGELQAVWALLPVPALFLLYLLGPGRARLLRGGDPDALFVWRYCVLFAAETLVDPLATGPGLRALGWTGAASALVGLLFVWLGDFRVYWLVFALGRAPRPAAAAAAAACAVPALAGAIHAGVLAPLLGEPPSQALWLAHELPFLTVALALRARLATRHAAPEPEGHRSFLRSALAYVALYYGVWSFSDMMILAGVDVAWALRALPNQLYYSFWVPWVFAAFARHASGSDPSGR